MDDEWQPISGIEALADVWASMDGKRDEFRAGRSGPDTGGRYAGYMADAEEMTRRLAARGYCLAAIE